MQTRHRVPTIFSIYMVDVLCCALGCIILLWQVYYAESEEQTAAALSAGGKLDTLEGKYKTLKDDLQKRDKENLRLAQELDAAIKSLGTSEQLALVRKKEIDHLRKMQTAAEALIASLQGDLKKEVVKSSLTSEELAAKIQAHAVLLKNHSDLMARFAALDKRLSAAERDLGLKQAALLVAQLKITDQSKVLDDAETRAKKLEKLLDELKAQGKDYLTKLSLSEAQMRLLQRELDRSLKDVASADRRIKDFLLDEDGLKQKVMISAKELALARAAIASLEGDKLKLIDNVRAIRTAAENRFAGVQLTGKNVLFLLDMSGSMDLIDENLADPDKWPLVCETVAKVLKSLPDLKYYQVIMFADKIRYPLGREGRWLDYDAAVSPRLTAEALKAIKPFGGTDMHQAFTEAFKFKDQGVDTIYVFSDGLPNLGDGLPAGGAKLNESQKTDILSKHIRQKLRKDWNPPERRDRIRINTIGFFFESPDVGAFLWALARENDGSFVGMSRP